MSKYGMSKSDKEVISQAAMYLREEGYIDTPFSLVNLTVDQTVMELAEALELALAWIDAVPQITVLPAMPGFDRDSVQAALEKARVEE